MTMAGTCCVSTTPSIRTASAFALGLLATLLIARIAGAHAAPYSYLTLMVGDGSTHGTLLMHEFDVAHEVGVADPAILRDPDTIRQHQAMLQKLLGQRLSIAFDDRRVQPQWEDPRFLAERQSVSIGFRLEHARPAVINLQMQLFPYDTLHQSFVEVHENDQLRRQAVLDANRTSLRYYSGTVQGRLAVIGTFLPSGAQHILIGPDHVLFLLGLLLLGGSFWRLAAIVTAFTAGHSVTLSLAALELVRLSPQVVEPVIALSIVMVGADNLLVQHQMRQDLRAGRRGGAARDLRPWLAGAFGLIHGFGFAEVLAQAGLPRDALGWSLAAFNVGVELGQLLVVLPVAALLWWLWHGNPRVAARTAAAGSLAVAAAGLYWFIQRI
jgi:hypothetical protein